MKEGVVCWSRLHHFLLLLNDLVSSTIVKQMVKLHPLLAAQKLPIIPTTCVLRSYETIIYYVWDSGGCKNIQRTRHLYRVFSCVL